MVNSSPDRAFCRAFISARRFNRCLEIVRWLAEFELAFITFQLPSSGTTR
jgi:hypothetical protein